MRRGRTLLLASALAWAGLTVASAKTYHIAIDETSMAGTARLAPGSYSVKLEGSNAVFLDQNGRKTEVPVKVENTGTKHEQTAVDTVKTNTGEKIHSIELGGSTETLQFGE